MPLNPFISTKKHTESDIPTDFTSQAKFLSIKQSSTYITRLIAQG